VETTFSVLVELAAVEDGAAGTLGEVASITLSFASLTKLSYCHFFICLARLVKFLV
jgi:hypothetical protein